METVLEARPDAPDTSDSDVDALLGALDLG
jgi:hypothetical protein